MDWYALAKVVHFLGLIALFGFFVVWSRVAGRLQASTTAGEARVWLGLLGATAPMVPSAAVMLAASGIAMAALRWRGPHPFVVVGMVAVVAIWLGWALVGARHLRAMRAALGESEGGLPPAAASLIAEPSRWGVLGALNGTALGVLVVMTAKLGWIAALSTVAALAMLVGFAFASAARRQRGARAVRHEEVRA